jgi:hypothetical protein
MVLQVQLGELQEGRVIVEVSQAQVALSTKKTTTAACRMVMVNTRRRQ